MLEEQVRKNAGSIYSGVQSPSNSVTARIHPTRRLHRNVAFSTTTAKMSHQARAEGYEEEQTEDEEEFESRNDSRTVVMTTNDYIKSSSRFTLHYRLN
jgi:hypothetical protein